MRSRSRVLILALAGMVSSALGCHRETTESKADEEAPPTPTGLVRISAESQESIGLETTQVRYQSITETIRTAGWLMVRPGNEVQVKAAATGFVVLNSDDTKTELGSFVANGQEMGKLQIFLSPQDEAQLVALKEDADILIEQSLASLAIAEDRYEKLKNIEGGVLAEKDVQALREVVERSRAAVAEAREKLPFLPPEPYERPLRLGDVAIHAPIAGRITKIHVQLRQLVVQGDPLWTVSNWSNLWLKVPVFEGDLPKVGQEKAIEITVPGSTISLQAQPTGIHQPTEDGRRTVDLLYKVANEGWRLRPGQPVSVRIPTSDSSKRIVVSQSALLWDGMGNSWVFVRESADEFRRQRVQVGPMHDDEVVIERGLKEGEEVVTVGAEALYGEEFKSQIAVEDDD